MDNKQEKIVNLCKTYGFIYSGSDIYGGLSNTFDYGPLGVMLKNNIKNAWIKRFVQENKDNVLLDSAIFMNKKVWEASGHIDNFTDPLIDCKSCKSRYRADKLIEEAADINAGGFSNEELIAYINENNIVCPKCGELNFTDVRQFNMMFKTNQGVIESEANTVYLRPETAQGIFVNFANIQRSMRLKLPFGVGQIGKSFRNEITPGNFIFRTREFEQMELEVFVKPGTEMQWFDFYVDEAVKFLKDIGISNDNLYLREYPSDELAHYSNRTTDIEYKFPFGQSELWGIASRTDFDLKAHMQSSGANLEYFDETDNTKYIPYVIEPSVGVDRILLACICDSFTEEELEDGTTREVLKISPKLAPYKVCVLPLIKKFHQDKANEIYAELSKDFMTCYDEASNIGKRYRRADVIGVPFCITIDDETLENNTVTIRDRDTMKQITLPLEEVKAYIYEKVNF